MALFIYVTMIFCWFSPQARRLELESALRAKSTVKEVTPQQLLEIVEQFNNTDVQPSCPNIVLVHVYSADETLCRVTNALLDSLSAKPVHNQQVRFLKVDVNSMPQYAQTLDRIMYPAFNVYRQGRPVESLVAVTRLMNSTTLNAEGLEKFFVEKRVFVGSTAGL